MRKELGFVAPALSNFLFSGNLTLVKSQIEMTPMEYNSRKEYEKTGRTFTNKRDMAGQSPYVINADLSYSDGEAGLNAGVFYNIKGPTLYIVGIGLFPDVYSEPFHSLNLSVNKTWGQENRVSLSFKVANLLNDKSEKFYKSFDADRQIFDSMNPGILFSVGASYTFR